MARPDMRSNPPLDRPRIAWPTAGQILRQIIIVAVVAAIWATGLATYVQLTGGTDKLVFASNTPTPTSVPASTLTPTPMPASPTDTPTAAPAETSTAEPGLSPAAGAGGGPSFAADVMPLFNKYCIRCHGSTGPRVGLSLTSHAAVMAGSRNGPVVTPGDAAASLLAKVVISGEMPPRGDNPTQAEIQVLADWINAGALDN